MVEGTSLEPAEKCFWGGVVVKDSCRKNGKGNSAEMTQVGHFTFNSAEPTAVICSELNYI